MEKNTYIFKHNEVDTPLRQFRVELFFCNIPLNWITHISSCASLCYNKFQAKKNNIIWSQGTHIDLGTTHSQLHWPRKTSNWPGTSWWASSKNFDKHNSSTNVIRLLELSGPNWTLSKHCLCNDTTLLVLKMFVNFYFKIKSLKNLRNIQQLLCDRAAASPQILSAAGHTAN